LRAPPLPPREKEDILPGRCRLTLVRHRPGGCRTQPDTGSPRRTATLPLGLTLTRSPRTLPPDGLRGCCVDASPTRYVRTTPAASTDPAGAVLLGNFPHFLVDPGLSRFYPPHVASAPTQRRTSAAFLGVAAFISSAGCSLLGPLGLSAGGGGRTGLTPSPVTALPSDALPTPGYDVFRVVAWVLATVAAALILAFVAKLLNGRRNGRAHSSGPESAAAHNRPAPPFPGPTEFRRPGCETPGGRSATATKDT